MRAVEAREVWRLCTRDDAYLVSDHGRIRRVGGRILSPAPTDRGYLKVTLCRGPRRQQAYVAHLVAEAFLGPRPAGHDVDHLDWRRTNNAVTNLRYLRSLENAVRWESRRDDGGNVWATPDTPPPDDHDKLYPPLTEDELAELAAAWGTDREEAAA